MDQKELLKLARRYFISDDGSSENNMIRKIQRAEGHVECFAIGNTQCEQIECRWRKDCLGDSESEVPVVGTSFVKAVFRKEIPHE